MIFLRKMDKTLVYFKCPSACYLGHVQMINLKAFSLIVLSNVDVRLGHSFSFVLDLCIRGQKGLKTLSCCLGLMCIKP